MIIPAYNEINTIKEILEKTMAVDISKEIIVIDDGSTDGTKEFLSKCDPKGMKVLFHKKNMGKGSAIKTGIRHSTGDIILIQDADLELDPQDYYELIKPIVEGKSKVVYGSRFLRFKYTSFNLFALGNRWLTFLANLLYKANITDEAIGYKVFKSEVLKSIDLKCKGFEFCSEVTAKIKKKGYKIFEVPVSYYPRKVSEGKKVNWIDAVIATKTLLKYRFLN